MRLEWEWIMNVKLTFTGLAAALLVSACAIPAGPPPSVDLLGAPAPENLARRTIVIALDTKWVNVTGGRPVVCVVFRWH
jgi:hypothetical protein